jgi:hypothetical protein
MAIEEPAFEILEKAGNVEIRRYRPVIVAETFVDGDMGSASNRGFRLIADYIFGNNLSVRGSGGQSSERIAMTAPVSVEPRGDSVGGLMHSNRWCVSDGPEPTIPAAARNGTPNRRAMSLPF